MNLFKKSLVFCGSFLVALVLSNSVHAEIGMFSNYFNSLFELAVKITAFIFIFRFGMKKTSQQKQ